MTQTPAPIISDCSQLRRHESLLQLTKDENNTVLYNIMKLEAIKKLKISKNSFIKVSACSFCLKGRDG